MLEAEEGRGRVLIVDDQEEIRELLRELLEADYDCVTAASAAEALGAIGGGGFDLLLSDITMPGMSGLELIPRALEVAPSTVIVMISGLQNIESAIEAMRFGAFDYITKPFDLDHVASAVRRTGGCASRSAATSSTSKNSSRCVPKSCAVRSTRSKKLTARP
jgi:DNA-binding NtrC family response regulator